MTTLGSWLETGGPNPQYKLTGHFTPKQENFQPPHRVSMQQTPQRHDDGVILV